MDTDVATLRTEYGDLQLRAGDVGSDPMRCFRSWFAQARTSDTVAEANAMALATVGASGSPSVRTVLLKDVDDPRAGFTWYTGLGSRKSREALTVGRAALCWWWPGEPGRQVRAVGRVEELDRDEVAAYFAMRPVGSRVGAAASHQSSPVASRALLDARADAIGVDRLDRPPAHWGGLRLFADELEFWQGRRGRLHDRFTFLRLGPDGLPVSADAVTAAGGLEVLAAAGSVVVDDHGTRWLRTRLEP